MYPATATSPSSSALTPALAHFDPETNRCQVSPQADRRTLRSLAALYAGSRQENLRRFAAALCEELNRLDQADRQAAEAQERRSALGKFCYCI
jgi:hypothetical protein